MSDQVLPMCLNFYVTYVVDPYMP
ncbi:hypothetical protein PMI35_05547, partial [Pseudomonas sp. GM78]